MSTANVSGNNTAVANNSVLFDGDNKAKSATNKKPSTPTTVVLPTKEKETSKPVEATAPTPAASEMLPIQKHIPTIREMQEKAEKMHLLSEKYNNLSDKKQDLDLFSISHDGDTARMRLTDAKGQHFESSNPVCIRQLIDIWKKTYTDAMAKTEEEMRQLMEA
ncbi:hypothetical protein [uncultured Parabacteroides sp.]|uniref:hypothetical protein n=1 Tax=uncultured Parabacteroides sp. TaxID=512312 RepID=UPI00259BAC6A|nr:hypothetical protein [uncultured Parabacteroides sp.]